jgi:hypothetical protein
MRTLTSYGIAVVIVLAVLDGIVWQAGCRGLHDLSIFSAGFVLGMLGMYTAAWLYGYAGSPNAKLRCIIDGGEAIIPAAALAPGRFRDFWKD